MLICIIRFSYASGEEQKKVGRYGVLSSPSPCIRETLLFNIMENKRKVLLVSVIILTTCLCHETCERNVYQRLQNITYSCHFLTLFSYSSYPTARTPSAPNEDNSCLHENACHIWNGKADTWLFYCDIPSSFLPHVILAKWQSWKLLFPHRVLSKWYDFAYKPNEKTISNFILCIKPIKNASSVNPFASIEDCT